MKSRAPEVALSDQIVGGIGAGVVEVSAANTDVETGVVKRDNCVVAASGVSVVATRDSDIVAAGEADRVVLEDVGSAPIIVVEAEVVLGASVPDVVTATVLEVDGAGVLSKALLRIQAPFILSSPQAQQSPTHDKHW